MMMLMKRLGKKICKLIYLRDKVNTMALKYDFLTNKMIIKFNIFHAGMKHQIRSHAGCTKVTIMQENGNLNSTTKFIKQVD